MDEVFTGSREEESSQLELEASESSTSSSSTSRLISWRPRPLAFRPYSSTLDTNAKPQLLRVVVRRPVGDFCVSFLLNAIFPCVYLSI